MFNLRDIVISSFVILSIVYLMSNKSSIDNNIYLNEEIILQKKNRNQYLQRSDRNFELAENKYIHVLRSPNTDLTEETNQVLQNNEPIVIVPTKEQGGRSGLTSNCGWFGCRVAAYDVKSNSLRAEHGIDLRETRKCVSKKKIH